MAIQWRPLRKRRCVKNVLKAHDARSRRCRDAAEGVIQIARTQDRKARFLLLRPSPECGPMVLIKEGRIGILPKIENPPKWVYHVCVETERHCVCALTGAGGTPREGYVEHHFQYAPDVWTIPIRNEKALAAALSEIS
jgi:hypothetical protein